MAIPLPDVVLGDNGIGWAAAVPSPLRRLNAGIGGVGAPKASLGVGAPVVCLSSAPVGGWLVPTGGLGGATARLVVAVGIPELAGPGPDIDDGLGVPDVLFRAGEIPPAATARDGAPGPGPGTADDAFAPFRSRPVSQAGSMRAARSRM